MSPDNVLCVGVRVEVLLELSPWEWVELLNPGDGSIRDLFCLAVFAKCGVNLTRAEDDALDFIVWCNLETFGIVCVVWNDPLEVRFAGKVFNAGAREGVSEE